MQHPTIAISDAFNAAGHALAAQLVWQRQDKSAALGFLLVALAASVGVLRFGFAEKTFARCNGDLAHLSAFLGLPMVGFSFAQEWLDWSPSCADAQIIIVALCAVAAMANSLPCNVLEFFKVLFNAALFLLPVAGYSVARRNMVSGGGIALFSVAGILIGSDREKTIFGVRCENLFHYAIGAASYAIAWGLVH